MPWLTKEARLFAARQLKVLKDCQHFLALLLHQMPTKLSVYQSSFSNSYFEGRIIGFSIGPLPTRAPWA